MDTTTTPVMSSVCRISEILDYGVSRKAPTAMHNCSSSGLQLPTPGTYPNPCERMLPMAQALHHTLLCAGASPSRLRPRAERCRSGGERCSQAGAPAQDGRRVLHHALQRERGPPDRGLQRQPSVCKRARVLLIPRAPERACSHPQLPAPDIEAQEPERGGLTLLIQCSPLCMSWVHRQPFSWCVHELHVSKCCTLPSLERRASILFYMQVNLEFLVRDRRTFVTGEAHALKALFGENSSGSASYKLAVATVCSRLSGVFASLKVFQSVGRLACDDALTLPLLLTHLQSRQVYRTVCRSVLRASLRTGTRHFD